MRKKEKERKREREKEKERERKWKKEKERKKERESNKQKTSWIALRYWLFELKMLSQSLKESKYSLMMELFEVSFVFQQKKSKTSKRKSVKKSINNWISTQLNTNSMKFSMDVIVCWDLMNGSVIVLICFWISNVLISIKGKRKVIFWYWRNEKCIEFFQLLKLEVFFSSLTN
jgi:hypothetical protein